MRRPRGVVWRPLGTVRGSQRAGDLPAVVAPRGVSRGNGPDDGDDTWHKLHSVRGATLVRPHRYAGSPTRS
jgi:hypothetical protein